MTAARLDSAIADCRSSTCRRLVISRCARPTAAIVLSYNGEIYNHAEIRRDIEAQFGAAAVARP